jgi:hypothetical protein
MVKNVQPDAEQKTLVGTGIFYYVTSGSGQSIIVQNGQPGSANAGKN